MTSEKGAVTRTVAAPAALERKFLDVLDRYNTLTNSLPYPPHTDSKVCAIHYRVTVRVGELREAYLKAKAKYEAALRSACRAIAKFQEGRDGLHENSEPV